MTHVEINEIEERLHGQLLYNVRANGEAGRFDLPFEIRVSGSAALNEEAVLRATLAFAEDLAAAARLRLPTPPAVALSATGRPERTPTP
jgi:hypothetical protein